MINGITFTIKPAHPKLSVPIHDLSSTVSRGSRTKQNTSTNLAVTLLKERILHTRRIDKFQLWTSKSKNSVSDDK